jgi:hypothetical protein
MTLGLKKVVTKKGQELLLPTILLPSELRKCRHCNKIFDLSDPSRNVSSEAFCSLRCLKKHYNTIIVCQICGRPFAEHDFSTGIRSNLVCSQQCHTIKTQGYNRCIACGQLIPPKQRKYKKPKASNSKHKIIVPPKILAHRRGTQVPKKKRRKKTDPASGKAKYFFLRKKQQPPDQANYDIPFTTA